MFGLRKLFLALLFPLIPIAVEAAEIEVLGKKLHREEIEKGRCTISMTGVIKPGDEKRLNSLLKSRSNGSSEGSLADSLCLDSPGGSLDAAVSMMTELKYNSVSTVVLSDATCLSACAIVFMGGTSAWEHTILNARYMFPTSRIGFHAPTLEVADGVYEKETVQKAFSVATAALGRVIKNIGALGAEDIAILPKSLVVAMLQHHGQDFLIIDYVDKAAAWDINVVGVNSAEATPQSMSLLCWQAYRWFGLGPELDLEGKYADSAFRADVHQVDRVGENGWIVRMPEWTALECEIEQTEDHKLKVRVNSGGKHHGENVFGGWAAFPGNTMLTSIAE